MPTQIKVGLDYDTKCPDKRIIRDLKAFEEAYQFLRSSSTLVFDFETSGLDWYLNARAIGLGLGAWDSKGVLQAYYIPWGHSTGEPQLLLEAIHGRIGELLASSALKIAHNIKFDEHIAGHEGWAVAGPRYDTMIAARLYDENKAAGLKVRAVEDLGRTDADTFEKNVNAEVYTQAKNSGMGIDAYRTQYGYQQINIALLGLYCCYDIEFTGQLYLFYEAAGISRLYSRVWQTEMELTRVLCKMETRGMAVDTDYLKTLQYALGGVQAGLLDSIKHQLGGWSGNIASDDDLRDLLQNRLGIVLTKLTEKKQLSVDKEVLAQFVATHPVLQAVLDWREAEKLRSTYTQSILERLDKNNILHPDYQQVGTYTGRLSCREPNFQNQPVDSDRRAKATTGKALEHGGKDPWSIRRAYIVGKPGWVRLFFDYSQIELRVLAYYTKDPALVEAYLTGQDIHERTSLEIFGTKDKSMRRWAKAINFGVSYVMTEHGYAAQVGISVDEARKHLTRFYERYAGISNFRLKFWAEVAARGGFFQNIFGRPRRIENLNNPDKYLRSKAQRKAIASIIQGTAAELTKESLVRIDRFLESIGEPAYLVATVHDEIQIDCQASSVATVAKEVKRLMEDFSEFAPIPIRVDAEYSLASWSDKQKIAV